MRLFSRTLARYKSMNVQAKASLWYMICNILQKGISFIVIPIYVRVLTTAEYGRYTVFQSWRDILIIFATLNLYCGIFTKAMVDYEDDRDVYTSSMQGLGTCITIFVLAVYLIMNSFWRNLLDLDMVTILMMFGYFVFYPAFSFWSVRKKVENKYVSMVIITLLVSVATPVISLLLLYFTHMREYAIIRGYLIVQCLVGGYFYVYHFLKGKAFFHKKYWGHAVRFNIPLIPHYLSLVVLNQSDRIMIKEFCGDDKAGIYSLAYQISTIMNVIISSVNGAFVPWIYQKLKIKEYDPIKKISSQLCVMMAVMTMGLTLVGPEGILIIGTQEYMEAIWLIPAISLGVFFTFVYNLFCNIEFYYNETHYVMIASMIGAILNVVLNAYFIPIYGFMAAGYTTLFCYFVFMLMHYFFMRKVCKEQKLGTYVFNNKFIGTLSLLLFILSFACMQLYSSILIRYIIVLCVCVITYSKREYIIKLLKRGN